MIIQKSLRHCVIHVMYIRDEDINALFHEWTHDGDAIVELEDGKCLVVSTDEIRFTDNMMSEDTNND